MSTPVSAAPPPNQPQRTDSGSATSGTSGVATPSEVAHSGETTPGDAVGGFGAAQHGMFGVGDGGDTTGFGGLVREPFVAPAAERPYGSYFDEVVDSLIAALGGVSIAASASERGAERLEGTAAQAVTKVVVDRGELMLHIQVDKLALVAATLRDDVNLRFELLSMVSGVDYLGTQNRLHVVYQLRSMTYRRRIGLEVAVPVDNPRVPSLAALYPTADWQERETWDMFGVVFDGHPALTRILMPDDWDGFPQRKDYPLGGIAVEYKGATIPPPDERRAYR